MLLHELDKHRDKGLLILRIGIGIMFICHGFPKLSAGPEVWTKIGGALSVLGIGFAPTLMGLLAALSEFVGGILLMLGLLTRPACFFLLITMLVATLMHMISGDSFMLYSHALESAILFLALLFIGPGDISLDEMLHKIKGSVD
ncbi:DoxX family protein [bacterium]|nr:DoxX family protein [bacterium]